MQRLGTLGVVLLLVGGLAGSARAIPTEGGTCCVAVNPDTSRLYATEITRGTVAVMNTRTNRLISRITVGDGPTAIGLNRATNLIYVENKYGDSISVIDGATDSVVATISTPTYGVSTRIGINPVVNRIYAISGEDPTAVAVIDGATHTIVSMIDVGYVAKEVDVNPVTNRVYVTRYHFGELGTDEVVVIDGATNTVIAHIPLGSYGSGRGLAVNPLTNRIYATAGDTTHDNVLVVMDGATNTILAVLNLRGYLPGVGVDSSANLIYVTDQIRDAVRVVDGATNILSQTFEVGKYPAGIVANPLTHRVYIANMQNISVHYVDDLLKNPSFDADSGGDRLPDRWTGQGLSPADYLVSYYLYDGKFAFLFAGDGSTTKRLTQRVTVSGPAGAVLTLDGFSKALDAAGTYGGRVRVRYTDGTGATFRVTFTAGTHDWERRTSRFITAKAFERLEVILEYGPQTGKAWFDAFHLTCNCQ